MARHLIPLLALFVCVWCAAPSAHAKPLPPVVLSWVSPDGAPPVSGATVDLTLKVRVGPVPLTGSLDLVLPEGLRLVSPPPAWAPTWPAGVTRSTTVTVLVTDPHHAPLRAVFTPRGADWRVQACWQVRADARRRAGPTPRSLPRALAPPVLRPQAAVDSTTFTGTFVYRNRAQDEKGFVHQAIENDPVSPVRRVRVQLLNFGSVMAQGETDDQGAFTFRLPETPGEYSARVVSVLPSHHVEVRGYLDDELYTAETPALTPETGMDVDFGQILIEADGVTEGAGGGEAFNVTDATLDGVLALETVSGAPQKHDVIVRWGHPSRSYYTHGSHTVVLAVDDGYDDSVILHEYGHYVIKDYSRDTSPGGDHFVNDDHQDPYLAWGEGMASFWQAAVRLQSGDAVPSLYIDTEGLLGAGNLIFYYDCELPSLPVLGTASEVVVHASLWDIIDGPQAPDPTPGQDDDALERPLADVWTVLTDYIPGASTLTLEDFWLGWFSPGIANGDAGAMVSAFTALGAEYVEDLLEPDDSVAQASPLVLNGPTVHHTFYPAGDSDHHSLSLDVGQQVLVETVNLVGWSDTRLQILDPMLTPVATNDDRLPGEDISSQVRFTAQLSGDYTVLATRVSKSYSTKLAFGSYDLRALEDHAHAYALVSVGSSAGVGNSGYSVGPSFGDYNGDGHLDLVVVNNTAAGPAYAADVLYRNQGNGVFANATQSVGLGQPEGGLASAWGDMDNDGDLDLFLSNHALYRNDNGFMTDVSESSNVVDLGSEFDGKWADADNDGYLDLMVALRDRPSILWHNNGDGTFADVAPQAGFDFPLDGGDAYACAWGDYDGDGLSDLFIAFNRVGDGHRLYHNLGNNTFADVTLQAGMHTEDAARGALWGDLNGDGLPDLYVCSAFANKLYINQGGGTFSEEAETYGVALEDDTRGAGLADYDLDGDLDLYLSNLGTPSALYENLGGVLIKTNQALFNGNAFGMAWGDYDNDGDPDAYVTRALEDNLLWRNESQQPEAPLPWIKVSLTGVISNRSGIGARVRVYSGNRVQVRDVGSGVGWASMSVQPELFGVPEGVVDSVRVDWPSGAWNVEHFPAADQTLVIEEDDSTPVRPPTPTVFRVSPPRPNPFSVATAVRLTLSRPARVTAEVYDLAGRRVARVVDAVYPAGERPVGWDGTTEAGVPAAPGVYFLRVASEGRADVRKVIRLP